MLETLVMAMLLADGCTEGERCVREVSIAEAKCVVKAGSEGPALKVPRGMKLVARICQAVKGETRGGWQIGIVDPKAKVQRMLELEPNLMLLEAVQVSPDGRHLLLSIGNENPVSGPGAAELRTLPDLKKVELPEEIEVLDIGRKDAVAIWHGDFPNRKMKDPGIIRARLETRVRFALPVKLPLAFIEVDRSVWECWQPCSGDLPTGVTAAIGKWVAH